MAKILALSVVVIACFFDPLQQVLLKGRYEGTVGWWHFHLVHWAAFYPVLIYVVFRTWPPFQVFCFRLHMASIPASGTGQRWYQIFPRYIDRKNIAKIAGITVLAWLTWRLGMWVSGAGWESFWITWIKKALN